MQAGASLTFDRGQRVAGNLHDEGGVVRPTVQGHGDRGRWGRQRPDAYGHVPTKQRQATVVKDAEAAT